MGFRSIIQITIRVLFTINVFCNVGFAVELKPFSSQELEKLEIHMNTIDSKGIFTLLRIIYSIHDPTLKIEDMERFISIAEMEKLDLNADGKEDIAVLVNQNATSDPVELLLLCSIVDGWLAQILPTERAVMANTVIDLNDDNLYEVCLNEIILGDTPHVAAMYWRDVYAWDGQSYVKSDEQFFESFYIRRYLPYIAQRIGDLTQRLEWGEHRNLVGSVLEDCRMALERVYTMRDAESGQTSLKNHERSLRVEEVRRILPQISDQIVHAQELLRLKNDNMTISHALENIQTALKHVYTPQDTEK